MPQCLIDFQTVDYSSMVKQRSLGPDNLEDGTDPSSAFLDALRTRAMDEMHEAALEYGIVLKDLGGFLNFFIIETLMESSTAVIDRQFKGEIASTMDKLTTRALQAQVEAAVSPLCVPLCFINFIPVTERRQGELEQSETGGGSVGGRTHQGASTQCTYRGILVWNNDPDMVLSKDTSRFRGLQRYRSRQSPSRTYEDRRSCTSRSYPPYCRSRGRSYPDQSSGGR